MSPLQPYTEWPSTKEGIGVLHLDPHNPRLARRNHRYTEEEIALELVANSDVLETATSIANEGYIPVEQLIGYKDDTGKKIVVEGNRRLLACRLLKDPKKAPLPYRHSFQKLHKKVDPRQITRLQILWAPSREAAWKLIARKHILHTVKDWKPIMQANFYLQPLEQGYSIPEAAKLLGVRESEIRSARFATQLYSAALELEMADEMKRLVTNPYDFKLTTLMRIVDTKEGKAFLGVDADDDGNALLKTTKKAFRERFHKVLSDISVGDENSRTMNKRTEAIAYINNRTGLPPVAPAGSGSTKLLVDVVGTLPESSAAPTKNSTPPRKRATPPKLVGLFLPETIPLEHKHSKLRNIMHELEMTSPQQFPNACALLLRTFLEMSTYHFLQDSKELDRWKAEVLATGGPNRKFAQEFRPMLLRIVEKKLLPDGNLLNSLRHYLNESSYKPWFTQMNSFVHNPTFHPNEERLRQIWTDMAPLAEALNRR